MNKIFASALMAVAMLGSVSEAEACSNFIVGKKASVDGSVMCSYSADDYGMFQYLCHYPAAKHAKGEMRSNALPLGPTSQQAFVSVITAKDSTLSRT